MDNTISLPIPPNGFIEHLMRNTDSNEHNKVRWAIASWIVKRLREQGGTISNKYYTKAMSFYCVFEAIATIHAELGYLPYELCCLRFRRTKEMLAFVAKINPEAEKVIRKAL